MTDDEGIKIETFEISVPRDGDQSDYSIRKFRQHIEAALPEHAIPVRFVVTHSDKEAFYCELGCVLQQQGQFEIPQNTSIFDFQQRTVASTEEFNVALIIPTGVGVEVGGQAGDAGPRRRCA